MKLVRSFQSWKGCVLSWKRIREIKKKMDGKKWELKKVREQAFLGTVVTFRPNMINCLTAVTLALPTDGRLFENRQFNQHLASLYTLIFLNDPHSNNF